MVPSILHPPLPLPIQPLSKRNQEFTRAPHLPHETVYVPPQHQPPNPEDEDDVVPDQHAAFGIARATQARRESAWKDLGLEGLVDGNGNGKGGGNGGGGGGGSRVLPR